MKLHVIDYGHNGDLPQSVRDQIPDDILQTIFRTTLNSHLRDGKSEMHAFTKAWRALSDLGYAKGEDGTWAIQKATAANAADNHDIRESPESPAADPNGPPPGLKPKATGIPRCGTCQHFDPVGHCLKFNGYPVNAGMVCSEWEAKPEVAKLYVPPAEVQAAAQLAMEQGVEAPDITEALAKGEGIGAAEVRMIVEHFANTPPAFHCAHPAWGGAQAAKWAGRVLKKLGPLPSPGNDGPGLQQLPDATTADVDFTLVGTIEKLDQAQHLVFGWASISEINGKPVTDVQGDQIQTPTLEDAAYGFMLISRIGGAMHEADDSGDVEQIGTVIESMVFTPQKTAAMLQSLIAQGIQAVLTLPFVGWWIGVKVTSGRVWQDIVSGKLTAFSIGGKGKRASV